MSSAAKAGVIIGVGHAERQDDGVGPHVARALALRGRPSLVHEGDGTGLLDLWASRRACIIIDAVSNGGPAGLIRVLTDPDDPGLAGMAFVHSSHRIGVPEAIALARTLGRLPPRLTVIGITGAAFGFGTGLSPAVAAAADHVIDWLAAAGDAFSDEALSALVPSAKVGC